MPRKALAVHNQKMLIERPTLARTFVEGIAFGAGSSIAQNIFRSIGKSETVIDSKPNEYKQCMTDYNDKAACAHLLEKA
jgi:hypothetical protein